MAEEFALSVNVDADMSRFRQTLRQELEAAQKQGATIPVGATGGAAGTSVVPPGAASGTATVGATLTASTVAQQSAQAVATAAARAVSPIMSPSPGFLHTGGMVGPATGGFGGFDPNGWQALHPGGWAAINAARGGAPAGTPGLPAGTPQQMPPVPIPLPGGGPRGGRGRVPFFGSGGGGGQFFTGAYAGNALGRLVEASNQYQAAQTLSRGDPEALAQADIQHRRDIADAFPVAGRLALMAREVATGEETAIRRTLQDAADQNSRTRRMREIGEMSDRYRRQGALAGAYGSTHARLTAEFEYQSQVYDVRQARSAAAEESHKMFDAQRADVERDFQKRQGPEEMRHIMGPQAEAWRDAQMQTIQTAENDAVAKQKDRFGPMLSSAKALRDRTIFDIGRSALIQSTLTTGAAGASYLRGMNRPFEAGMSERMAAMGAAMLQSDPLQRSTAVARAMGDIYEYQQTYNRNFRHEQRDIEGQGRVLDRMLDRDVVGAARQRTTEEYRSEIEETESLPPDKRQERQKTLSANFNRRISLINQEDSDARQLRIQSLDNRREHFDLLAEGKPFTARARDIQRETEADVAEMRQSKRYGEEEIRKRIESGVAEEKAFERQLRMQMNAGFGMQVASGSVAPGGGGGANQLEPLINASKAIEDAIKALHAALIPPGN